jgi:mono/diheme cytochrome c family protein
VFISNAPDGTLYIADMYRGIIEHRISTTEYLRDQILSRKLQVPTGMGRIYRVVHDTTRRDAPRSLANASTADLVALLSHPNAWWRETGQRLIIERADKAAVPALKKLAETATEPRLRLRALWTLDGLDAIEPEMATKAMDDESRDVRVGAVRIAERWLDAPNATVAAAVLKRLDDPEAPVRRQVAASIGVLPRASRDEAAVSVLARFADDPIAVDAALSSIPGGEATVLDTLLADPRARADAAPAVIMLAATIVRSGEPVAVQNVFSQVADGARAEWQRSALLRGAEVALLGAPAPGARDERPTVLATNGPLPCPTCPGGRAGPGGSYAFQRPGDPTIASTRDRRGPPLKLDREPSALSTAAATTDDLGRRAAAVLARVTWPGKPGAEAVAPPLSADEQKRFDEGREVYRNICQACHQPDGRGQEKLAPALVGSALALAAPEIPSRILLGGKEGPIGLMPPIGSALNDEQIAGVLTYIRREWGQTGSPVNAATVKDVREQTAGRTRPWTDAELRAMLPK